MASSTCSSAIVEIGKMGITQDAEGDALTLHAKDVFDLDREPALPTQGGITFTDSTGSPQTFPAGTLLFESTTNPEITFKSIEDVTVPAFGTSPTFAIAADTPGSLANIQGTDLGLTTPPAGITMTVAPGTAWITQSGVDEESDDKLRLRCETRWAELTTTGPYDSYVAWALASSSEITRVRIQEDPSAVYPFPAVTVIVAGPTGSVSTASMTALQLYVGKRRPLGTYVAFLNGSPFSVTIQGTYSVKTSFAAAAKSYIAQQLKDWFEGKNIIVNGETVLGLNVGDTPYISQVYELIMSAPGVKFCALTDGAGGYLPSVTNPEVIVPSPSADSVPKLVTSDLLLVPVLVS
jgi:hypothetical protein